MKKLINITFRLSVFVASLLMIVTSCKKDDDSSSVYYAIQGGKFSGTINGISTGDVDYVKAVFYYIYDDYYYEYILGADSISTDHFSIDLTEPPSEYMEVITVDSGMEISDNTVKGLSVYITCYKNGVYTGNLGRASSITVFDADTFKKGDTFCGFMYVDKAVKVSGQTVDNDESGDKVYNFNLKTKAGWNELINKCTSDINNVFTFSVYANNEPGGLNWYLY